MRQRTTLGAASRNSLLTVLIGFGSASSAEAQVPDCTYLVSAYRQAGSSSLGGLFLVDSRQPGCPTTVGNVSNDLTGAPVGPDSVGANAVQLLPSGQIVVAPWGPPGMAIDLHVLTLSGTTVAQDTTYPLGTVVPNTWGDGGVNQMALLPNGDVLLGVWGLGQGPLGGYDLGLFEPSSGTVTAIPVTGAPALGINGLAVDPTGTVAYLAEYVTLSLSRFWTVPVAGGAAAPLPMSPGPFPYGVTNLAFDAAGGRLLATCSGGGGRLVEIDPTTGVWNEIPAATGPLNAVAIEPVTGDLALATQNAQPSPASVFWSSSSLTLLTTGCGWGYPSGVTVAPLSTSIGTAYCSPAIPNSTGQPGRITATGSAGACGHSVTLTASDLPSGQFGYFLNSKTQASTFPVPNSQGTLCLGGAIGRYNMDVFNTGVAGTGTLPLDLASTPTPSGTVAIHAGETWNFTAWFRDDNPGPTSNFTDGVSIAFH